MDRWEQWAKEELFSLKERNLLRSLRALKAESATNAFYETKRVTLFSSNDYLGFSSHPLVKKAVLKAVKTVGLGPRGSALICGYTTSHQALEEDLASLKQTESALLFPTGFAANIGVLSAFASREVAIFSDALNHASIIDGTRLAKQRGAKIYVYPHNNMHALETLLGSSNAPRKIIVTDSLFSMDGDLAPLQELVELKKKYQALLIVDEAHATLVFGKSGGGVAEHFGVADQVDIHVGTLSKAIGSMGGFVATTNTFRNLILQRARAFIFSTALPIPVVEAASSALQIFSEQPELQDRLWARIRQVREKLGDHIISPIISIIFGEEIKALSAQQILFNEGFHVIAIRPPTVPKGTSRLRITLSAAHTKQEVDRLLEILLSLKS